MNDAAGALTTLPPDAASKPKRAPTLVRRILTQTFSRWGARLGLAWIAVLTLMGVFAPMIANSRPLLMKMDGQWSSPMLADLSFIDIALLAGFFAAVLVCIVRRGRMLARFGIVIGVTFVAGLIAWGAAGEQAPQIYDMYRTAQRDGRIEFMIQAPIPYSPRDRLRDQPSAGLVAPWWAWWDGGDADVRLQRGHWLGNEVNGADMASRMIHACRIALTIGFIATGIAMIIGVTLGGFMGYYAGAVDLIGMRLVEIFEFIPTLFLLLMFVAFYGRNIYLIMIIIGLTTWPGYARFTRGEFLKLRQQDFVLAAQACGLPLRSILFRHMLPNGISPVLVSASFGVASAILYEATLSFLGLGLVDDPSWGELLNQAVRGSGGFTWWIAIFPGLAIFLTVFAYNLIGESLRDAIDPHLKKSAHL